MEIEIMKTQVKHSERTIKVSSLLLGIVLTLVVVIVVENIARINRSFYTPYSYSSIETGRTGNAAVIANSTLESLAAYEASQANEVVVVEDWMSDLSTWAAAPSLTDNTVEMALPLEGWMSDLESWADFSTPTEELLTMESWMSDLSSWATGAEFEEPEIALEGWMMSLDTWAGAEAEEAPLAIESWMYNLDEWNRPLEVASTTKANVENQ
jgi:hypothetical protein